ncbi:protein kinase domain-containing protein [Allorhodopirellula solitaria]|uniref:Serine/threonine-protein kinase PknB n=1 Tax=Allorhodopirellula solitaria TaxID=2527987 RepID=A0A5C5WQP4_9BACT|nr:protein kinase [Allorhodopirellula solitaria]TWT52112.1 Serine/threonine-protein kinase PknB [Allorhodopirellula solitaria]
MCRSPYEAETGPPEDESLGVAEGHDEFSVAPSGTRHPPSPPRLLTDRYQVLELLQTGGMGWVYRAHDRMLDRDVALKVLRNDRAMSSFAAGDFAKEAQVMSFLSHPGVTPIYETGVCENGQPFHVMKLVDGMTLRQMLEDGRAETAELLNIFTDVCQTMAFAHTRGVIHLDLKPSNIMVGAFGEVHVMDWGLAQHVKRNPLAEESQADGTLRAAEAAASAEVEVSDLITRQAHINGTPQYMSPEQARGSTLDARADVFSLGGILCELLSGHAPYEGESLRQVYRCAVRGKTFLSLERLRRCGLDDTLVRLAINCLQIEVSDRPANARVLAHVIQAHQMATLRSVQSDMNRFFELSPDMFCIADRNGFFVRVNDNFSRVLGYSTAELLSKPFVSFVHEEDADSTIAQVEALNQGRPVIRFRNRYRTSQGKWVTLEWTAKSIENEQLVFAVARDVTTRSFNEVPIADT